MYKHLFVFSLPTLTVKLKADVRVFPLQVWYAASYAEFVNKKIHEITEEERKGDSSYSNGKDLLGSITHEINQACINKAASSFFSSGISTSN